MSDKSDNPLNEMFDAPEGSLIEASVMLHEWFLSLVDSGFTEDQAITLISNFSRKG